MDTKSTSKNRPSFPILRVVQHYVKTHLKGANHWAVCPFHSDSSPSLSISQEKNIFKCFACNVSGDAVTFVMRIEKCTYVNAIKKISRILNLNVSEFLSKKETGFQRLYSLNELIADAYHRNLFSDKNKDKLGYLTGKRRLSVEIIKRHRIGYAPNEDIIFPTIEAHKKQGNSLNWTEEELREIGIFKINRSGEKEAYFRERIVFPIHDVNGQVIGFSGRALTDEHPKYLNIQANSIFSKKDAIFNINNLTEHKPIYLYEGFIDLISCEMAGFSNGLACMGGSLNTSIIESTGKASKDVYCCFDNDNAGHTFTINICKSLIHSGFNARVVDLLDTEFKDIDEYLKSDREGARKALGSPVDFYDWWYKKESQDKDLSNPINFKIWLTAALETLFMKNRNNQMTLIHRTNPETAVNYVDRIFSYYEKLRDFRKEKYRDLIEGGRGEYKEIITKSVLVANIEVPSEEPIRREDSSLETLVSDPFTRIAIKYQGIIYYLEENREKIREFSGWLFEIPKKHVIPVESIETLFSVIRKNSKSKSPRYSPKEKSSISFLKSHIKYSVSIRALDEFFNLYYSLIIDYLENLRLFIVKDDKLEWVEESRVIKELIKSSKKTASDFFYSFHQKLSH